VRKNFGPLYVAPMTVWAVLFVVIPISIILCYSFMTKNFNGGVIYQFSLDAYRSLNNSTFFRVALNTLWVALVATAVMVALAIPASYYMARSKYKNFFLLLVIIPFWTNFLIRIFAWMEVLGSNGILNNILRRIYAFGADNEILHSILISIGITGQPVQFLFNTNAVILVTIYTYLPFAILPLYSTIEKFDFSLLEAARDLGASKLTATIRILLPNIRGGITTAVLFTFTPAFGNYAIPNLIGGNNSYMLGNVIAHELNIARNWPLASSMSVILTVITTVGVLIFMRLNRSSAETAREERLAADKAARASAQMSGAGAA
jgi:spermidine/putrescine transport system permease protein